MSTAMWKLEKDLCRCCHAEGSFTKISEPCFQFGQEEIYYDMLIECLDIKIIPMTGELSEETYTICESCIVRLRDASNFKRQVLDCEESFKDMYSTNLIRDVAPVFVSTDDEEKFHRFDDDREESELPVCAGAEITKTKSKTKSKSKSVKRAPATRRVKKSIEEDGMAAHEAAVTKKETKIDASKRVKSCGTPRMTSENFTENRHLRSNIALILRNSTILPFRHINKYKYSCLYCDNSYLFFEQLKTHTNEKHCNVTEKEIFQRLKNPKNLIKAELSDMRCKICESTFQSIDHLVEHLVKKHNRLYYDTPKFKPSHGILGFDLTCEKFTCHVCKKEFRFFKNLSVHMNEHSANFVCQFCGKKVLSLQRLHAHVKQHKPTELKCLHCERTFRSISARNYHVRRVHNPMYKCPECKEVFKQYQTRMQHLVDVHDVVKPEYKCDICEKNFANSGALRAHVRNCHLRNKEYPCPICDKSFGYKSTYKEHLIVHTGVKNFECKLCSRRFAKPKTLKVHMRIHLNEKPYACPVCKVAFRQKGSLKNHVRVHHTDAGVDLNKL